MAHVFGDNEKESDYGYVYKVSGPRTYRSALYLCLCSHCFIALRALKLLTHCLLAYSGEASTRRSA